MRQRFHISSKRKKNKKSSEFLVGLLSFFFYLGFLPQPFTKYRTAGEGEDIPLTPHYQFYPLHRHLNISWAIAVDSSSLQIGSSRTRTGNLQFCALEFNEWCFLSIISEGHDSEICFGIIHLVRTKISEKLIFLNP